MKAMIKDAVILFVITLIAGLALGYVYFITKEPIMQAELLSRQAAYKEVFLDADSYESISVNESIYSSEEWKNLGFEGITVDDVELSKDSGQNKLGYVISLTTNEGYGGNISFSMGIRNDGTINGLSILSISETAGLGMRAEEVLLPQFAQKNASEFIVTKNGSTLDNEIDAISGATITSKAVTKAVNAGLIYFKNELGGGF